MGYQGVDWIFALRQEPDEGSCKQDGKLSGSNDAANFLCR